MASVGIIRDPSVGILSGILILSFYLRGSIIISIYINNKHGTPEKSAQTRSKRYSIMRKYEFIIDANTRNSLLDFPVLLAARPTL